MADAVTTQTIIDGSKTAVLKFTNVDRRKWRKCCYKGRCKCLTSTNYIGGNICTGATIQKIWWQCNGMKVQLLFDATSDVFCIELGENQSGYVITQLLVVYQIMQDVVKLVIYNLLQ